MKFSTILASGVLASTALAAPGTAIRRERTLKKKAAALHSQPFIPANVTGITNGPEGTKNVEYSENWAGAAIVGTSLTGVVGTFKIPAVSKPSGGSSSTAYSASAWVGIDGYTCETAILQTGVDFTIQDGEVSYDAWYEWYPDYAYDFSGISFSEGDSVKLTIVATSKSAGKATIENVSTGKTVTHSFSSESNKLCETNAEWIVEDYESGSSLVPLLDFGTVTFTSASATEGGSTVGVSGAQLIDMSTSGTSSNIEAVASLSGSSSVIVTWK